MTPEEKERLGLALFAGAFALTTTVLRKEPINAYRALGTALFAAVDRYRQAKREEVVTVDIDHEEIPNLQLIAHDTN